MSSSTKSFRIESLLSNSNQNCMATTNMALWQNSYPISSQFWSNLYAQQWHNKRILSAFLFFTSNFNGFNNKPNPSCNLSQKECNKPTNQKRKRCKFAGNQQPKKRRHSFTALQTNFLDAQFRANRYINTEQRAKIAAMLGLSQQQVKIWFQNRRYKERCGRRSRKTVNAKM